MKMYTLLTFILICFGTIGLYAQCSITDLTVMIGDCSSDNEVDVTIDFNFTETSDSFDIRGNGQFYGTYAYSDKPIVLTIEPVCDQVYEFEVRDRNTESCLAAIEAGMICCNQECDIEIIDVNFDICDDSGISFTLNVERTGTDQVGFDLFSGNTMVGFFNYDDLPVQVSGFPSSGTELEEIIVCNNDNSTCCDTLVVETPCGCTFLNASAQIVDCDENREDFFVIIDFTPQMTSDSFLLGGNGNSYGTFAYTDLPITIGPLPFSESVDYEFIYVDRLSPFCFGFVEAGMVNNCGGSCLINNVTAQVNDCNGEEFTVLLDFDVSGTRSDSFLIRGNGQEYGTYAYDQEIYELGPLAGDCSTLYEFVVIDSRDADCQNFIDLDGVICCSLPCPIDGLIAELNCVNDSLDLVIQTNDSGDADTVEVFINEQFYLKLGYNELETSIALPQEVDFPLIIDIIDPINRDCRVRQIIESPCPDCFIGDIVIDFTGCDETNTMILSNLNFEHNRDLDSEFKVFLYAELLGDFSYNDLPITLPPFLNPNFDMQFTIVDGEDPECRITVIESTYTCSTHVSELTQKGIMVSTLPGGMILRDNLNRIQSWSLFDLAGRRTFFTSSENNVDGLQTGIYILRVEVLENLITTKVFIP